MRRESLEVRSGSDWTISGKKVEIEDALTRVQPVRSLVFRTLDTRFSKCSTYFPATRHLVKCGNDRELGTGHIPGFFGGK